MSQDLVAPAGSPGDFYLGRTVFAPTIFCVTVAAPPSRCPDLSQLPPRKIPPQPADRLGCLGESLLFAHLNKSDPGPFLRPIRNDHRLDHEVPICFLSALDHGDDERQQNAPQKGESESEAFFRWFHGLASGISDNTYYPFGMPVKKFERLQFLDIAVRPAIFYFHDQIKFP